MGNKSNITFIITALMINLISRVASAQDNFLAYQPLPCDAFISEALCNDTEFHKTLQAYLKSKYNLISARSLAAWTLDANASVGYIPKIFDTVDESTKYTQVINSDVYVNKLFMETGTRFRMEFGTAFASDINSSNVIDQINSPAVSIQILQPLLKNIFGLADRFPVREAEYQIQAAKFDAEEAWENEISKLYLAYIEWCSAFEHLKIMQNVVLQTQQLQKEVEQRTGIGLAGAQDRRRMKDRLLEYQAQLPQLEAAFESESLKIAFLRAGKAIDASKLEKFYPYIESVLKDAGNIKEITLAEVAGLRLKRKLDILRKQMVENELVSANAMLPALDFVGGVNYKPTPPPYTGWSPLLNHTNFVLGLQINYPFGSEKGRGEIGTVQASIAEVEDSTTGVMMALTLGLSQTAKNIKSMQTAADFMNERLENDREKLNVDKKNYRSGQLDTFYLSESENDLMSARLRDLENRVELKKQLLLYLSTGDLLLKRFPELEKQFSR